MVLQYVLLYFNVRDQWNPHDENQEEDLMMQDGTESDFYHKKIAHRVQKSNLKQSSHLSSTTPIPR